MKLLNHKIPYLLDGKVDLFESGALLLYLNDKYDDGDTVDK
jgi:glutathione S-transferase